MDWAQYLRTFLQSLALLVIAVFTIIVTMNPFGNLPWHPFGQHVVMDSNQRFRYPAIIRTLHYDSIIVGTSTSRLLDPADLDTTFGGHFANLAMNDARAWEQVQLAKLFLRTVPNPRTIVVGLDVAWCAADADRNRITSRGFPTWMFEDDMLGTWLHLFNYPTLEISTRKLGYHLGINKVIWTVDGFNVFVPPESNYNLDKATKNIWGDRPHSVAPAQPASVASSKDREAWRFPAVRWLDDLRTLAPPGTKFIYTFMPVHVAAQPQPGTRDATREAECKRRIANNAARFGTPVVDMRISSTITSVDSNYWDGLHYRLPIGRRIVADVNRAVTLRIDDPNGDWLYLSSQGNERSWPQ